MAGAGRYGRFADERERVGPVQVDLEASWAAGGWFGPVLVDGGGHLQALRME